MAHTSDCIMHTIRVIAADRCIRTGVRRDRMALDRSEMSVKNSTNLSLRVSDQVSVRRPHWMVLLSKAPTVCCHGLAVAVQTTALEPNRTPASDTSRELKTNGPLGWLF